MKVKLVPIGNSKGVRIPRAVIKECGFGDQIDMRVEHGNVVLAAAQGRRQGWDEAFRQMAAAQDDTLLLPEALGHGWDEEEWTW